MAPESGSLPYASFSVDAAFAGCDMRNLDSSKPSSKFGTGQLDQLRVGLFIASSLMAKRLYGKFL